MQPGVDLGEDPFAHGLERDGGTVRKVEFYELAKILPYKPGASIGVYEDYLYGPGSLVSRSWFLDLPSWAYVVIAQQTLWQWSGLFFGLAVIFGATFFVYRCG